MMQRITTAIDSYFCLTERKSTIRNEIMGGTTTFLTMSYIIVVNPKTLLIMGVPTNDGGMDIDLMLVLLSSLFVCFRAIICGIICSNWDSNCGCCGMFCDWDIRVSILILISMVF